MQIIKTDTARWKLKKLAAQLEELPVEELAKKLVTDIFVCETLASVMEQKKDQRARLRAVELYLQLQGKLVRREEIKTQMDIKELAIYAKFDIDKLSEDQLIGRIKELVPNLKSPVKDY